MALCMQTILDQKSCSKNQDQELANVFFLGYYLARKSGYSLHRNKYVSIYEQDIN